MNCKQRERISKQGGGSTRRTAARTRVTQISRKLGWGVEGGPFPAGTHPLKAYSTVGWEMRLSRTICAASRMAGRCPLRRTSTAPATSRDARLALVSYQRRLQSSSWRDLVRDRCRTISPLTVAWFCRIAERSDSAQCTSAQACCSSCM